MRIVGEGNAAGRRAETLAGLRVVGGDGLWRSMRDYQETVEKHLPDLGGSGRARNHVLAALYGVRAKFGTAMANGLVEAYGLEEFGFSMFKTGPAAR